MKFRHVQTSERSRNTCNSDFSIIDLNLGTKITRNLNGCLIVSAWSVSMKMRCTLCQRSSNDGSLSKAL